MPTSTRGLARVVTIGAVVAALGCDGGSEQAPTAPRNAEIPLASPPPTSQVPAPLPSAHCEVNVTGTGVIDLEEVYLPGVVTCENGGANIEALKAQAIAARSVAYYNMETEGEICDSQGCQVFSCGNDPLPAAIEAVQATSGMYLMYNSTLTYGFYVAGDNNTSGPGCVGQSGSTEQWVTYNSGQSGTDVEQTELGFVHPTGDPSYGQNRGCMGQWGARCLENENGADYMDILRFYYGEDIQVVQAEGACVTPMGTTGGGESGGEASGAGADTGAAETSGDPSASGGDSTGIGGGTGVGEAGDETGKPDGDDGSEDDGGPSSASGSGGVGNDSALPDGFGEDATNSSCACSSEPRGGGWAAAFLLLLVGLRRRRR